MHRKTYYSRFSRTFHDVKDEKPNERTRKLLLKELVDCIKSNAPSDELRILLARGAQIINEPVTQGLRPLHYAIFQRHYEAAQLLLTRSCDVNVLDDCGYSPLHLAAEHGYMEMVELLLMHGARVNFNPNTDETFPKSTQSAEPLRLALRNKHLHVARTLLEHGADPNKRYFFGAEINLVSDLESLDLLLSFGARPDSTDRSGLTPLMKAAKQPHGMGAALVLIQYGADVNAMADQRHYYRTVLHFSVLSGNYEIINLMVKQGARLNYDDTNDFGKPSPLDLAILRGDPRLVELLIESGANVNYSSPIIGSPLHVACAVDIPNRYEILQMLLRSGADPNHRLYNDLCVENSQLRPVLVDYLANNVEPNLAIINLLRKYGARVSLKTQVDVDGTLRSVQKNCESILLQLLEASDAFDICLIRRHVVEARREVAVNVNNSNNSNNNNSPWSLKRQARLFLWRFMGGNSLIDSMQKLNLPKCLETYLLFDCVCS